MNIRETISELKRNGNFRAIPPHTSDSGLLDFSTNDYLGLTHRADLRKSFLENAARNASQLSASASRLLAADQLSFNNLEDYLAKAYGREALIFNSGYHANVGLVSALSSKHTLIVADKLVHASIIDGIKLGGGTFKRFRHNDTAHLARILEAEKDNYENMLIIVESVYSMDGDTAPLQQIIELKKNHPNALLYVDEAHALGVLGPSGLGLASSLEAEQMGEVDIIIGTFGKAVCSSGAFAALSNELKQFAINKARSLIFSTALPPISAEWTLYIMQIIAGMDAERHHLANLAKHLSSSLKEIGLSNSEPSHICPIIIGDTHRAMKAASLLADDGIKVLPIRTPTVAAGTERLRVSLSAANSFADVDRLVESLSKALRKL